MFLTPIEQACFAGFCNALNPIASLLDDDSVSEVMINHARSIWIERAGKIMQSDISLSETAVRAALRYLASGINAPDMVAGTPSGIIHAAYKNLRVAGVLFPTALDGDAICIRKHHNSERSEDDYLTQGSFDANKVRLEKTKDQVATLFSNALENKALVRFLKSVITNRKNILIAGGTNAGKTSLLNLLLSYIPSSQRVITIEDTAELKVNVPNRLRLMSNKSQGVTVQTLVELCLRMRPDRIVLGEIRSAEALDFIQALNTGHGGGMASVHANSARMALTRLESLLARGLPPAMQLSHHVIRADIADAIDYVMHFQKAHDSGFRFLNELLHVQSYENGGYQTVSLF